MSTLDAPDRVSGVRTLPGPLDEGALVGRFRVGAVIGQGAQGTVYRGEHLTLGYPVAIKVMHADHSDMRRARFRREARLGAALCHRHVARVLEAGELDGGDLYLVMEFVEGESLADVLDDHTLPPGAVVELGLSLLAALSALAERGIVHRDVKPENIMLERTVDGEIHPKLLDFGISKARGADLNTYTLTCDGTVVGTPHYMSFEHVSGEELDVRSDLYAVSAVLFECLTGQPPLDGPTVSAVFAKVASEHAPPVRSLAPACPPSLADVIDRGLRRAREERWESPQAMAEAMREVARALALPRGADAWREGAPPASPPRPAPQKRVPMWMGYAAAGLAGALTVGTILLTQPTQAAPPIVRMEKDMRTEPAAEKELHAITDAYLEDREALARREVGPSLDELERSARGLFVRGESTSAISLYRQVVERDPERATAWRGLGLVASSMGHERTAQRALAQYLRLAPEADDRGRIERELRRLQ